MIPRFQGTGGEKRKGTNGRGDWPRLGATGASKLDSAPRQVGETISQPAGWSQSSPQHRCWLSVPGQLAEQVAELRLCLAMPAQPTGDPLAKQPLACSQPAWQISESAEGAGLLWPVFPPSL